MQLTEKQEKVLEFLRAYTAEHQQSPSTRDVSEHFAFASNTAAIAHLRALERKGKITRSPHVPRSIVIL